MRNNNGYEMRDNIKIYYNGSEEIQDAVKAYDEFINSETSSVSVEFVEDTTLEVQN